MEWEVLRNTLICQKDVGRGSGSMGRAINSVKNAKMKRVGAGWGRIQLVDRWGIKRKVVNILSYNKVGRQMGNKGGPKGRGA
jgi:hypothetical protein